jgi:hypothetical protein
MAVRARAAIAQLAVRSRQEDWMTFTLKLMQADGTPADPPVLSSPFL